MFSASLPALIIGVSMSFGGLPKVNTDKTISNLDSFYPDFELTEFIKNERLPAEYSLTILEEAIAAAMVAVNDDLDEQKNHWLANGQTSLSKAQAILYQRAVFRRAHAESIPLFKTIVNRPAANNAGKEAEEQSDDLLTQSTQAIRQLCAMGRLTAELI